MRQSSSVSVDCSTYFMPIVREGFKVKGFEDGVPGMGYSQATVVYTKVAELVCWDKFTFCLSCCIILCAFPAF